MSAGQQPKHVDPQAVPSPNSSLPGSPEGPTGQRANSGAEDKFGEFDATNSSMVDFPGVDERSQKNEEDRRSSLTVESSLTAEPQLATPSVRGREVSVRRAFYYPSEVKNANATSETSAIASNPTIAHSSPKLSFEGGVSLDGNQHAACGTMPYQIKLVGGSCAGSLGKRISSLLAIPQTNQGSCVRDEAGVLNVQLKESVASHDVYVMQRCGNNPRTKGDVNSSLLELLFLIRKLKLGRAERVTVVAPYFPYARQDRKTELRQPLSASAVSQMITKMGADRVVTLDLHSGQVQGCFPTIPFDNLEMKQEFAHWLSEYLNLENCDRKKICVISPDAGGVERAKKLGDAIKVHNLVTIMKRRVQAGSVATMQTVGDVKGMTCIIVDDMVDTGGTLAKACELLVELGAVRVIACITHGVLSDPACANISNCAALETIVVSDSLPQSHNLLRCKKLRVLPIAPLLANVIARHHSEQSVSDLFNIAHATPTPKTAPKPSGEGAFPSSPPTNAEPVKVK